MWSQHLPWMPQPQLQSQRIPLPKLQVNHQFVSQSPMLLVNDALSHHLKVLYLSRPTDLLPHHWWGPPILVVFVYFVSYFVTTTLNIVFILCKLSFYTGPSWLRTMKSQSMKSYVKLSSKCSLGMRLGGKVSWQENIVVKKLVDNLKIAVSYWNPIVKTVCKPLDTRILVRDE